MSETGDLSEPEIEIFSEEEVTVPVIRGTGHVCDFLQSLVYSEAVFKLTSIGEVDMILVEECALKFFSESVVVVILDYSLGDVCFVGRGKSFGRDRAVR